MRTQSDTEDDAPVRSRGRRVIGIGDVQYLTGKHHATLRRWWQNGIFPAPMRTGPNSIGWFEDEVVAWLESRPRVATISLPFPPEPGPQSAPEPTPQSAPNRPPRAPQKPGPHGEQAGGFDRTQQAR